MNNSTLIIIAIVAGVFAWSKGWLGGTAKAQTTTSTSGTTTSPPPGYAYTPSAPVYPTYTAGANSTVNTAITAGASVLGDVINYLGSQGGSSSSSTSSGAGQGNSWFSSGGDTFSGFTGSIPVGGAGMV